MYTSEREARAAFDHWRTSLEPGARLVLVCETLGGHVHYHIQHYSSREAAEYADLINNMQFDVVDVATGGGRDGRQGP